MNSAGRLPGARCLTKVESRLITHFAPLGPSLVGALLDLRRSWRTAGHPYFTSLASGFRGRRGCLIPLIESRSARLKALSFRFGCRDCLCINCRARHRHADTLPVWRRLSALYASPAKPGLSGSPCRSLACLVFFWLAWLAFVSANNVGIVLSINSRQGWHGIGVDYGTRTYLDFFPSPIDLANNSRRGWHTASMEHIHTHPPSSALTIAMDLTPMDLIPRVAHGP